MQVHKFGGASVKSAAALKNVAKILSAEPRPAVVVLSAMGKMTNALEVAVERARNGSSSAECLKEFRAFHRDLAVDLFPQGHEELEYDLSILDAALADALIGAESKGYHRFYDSIVPFGELFSTCITSHYLQDQGLAIELLNARKLVHTDDTFREAKVDWDKTAAAIRAELLTDEAESLSSNAELDSNKVGSRTGKLYLVQGFIGSTPNGDSTTLGREGSDFTAAIFASALKVKSVTLWKDVAGVFSADPKRFDQAIRLEKLSYWEALEMANYGAKVIHPKTLKPLENGKIPLYVRSFEQPEQPGTVIEILDEQLSYPPLIVKVEDLTLLKLQVTDLSYISDQHLHLLFELFEEMRIRVYIMQTGFITLSAAVSLGNQRLEKLVGKLEKQFTVQTDTGLELLTVRHYRADDLSKFTLNKEVFLEQRSRETIQLLLSSNS